MAEPALPTEYQDPWYSGLTEVLQDIRTRLAALEGQSLPQVPGQVATLTALATATSIVVTWTAPLGPAPDEYILQYRKSTETDFQSVTLAIDASPYTISGLDDETLYIVQIFAVNDDVNGPGRSVDVLTLAVTPPTSRLPEAFVAGYWEKYQASLSLDGISDLYKVAYIFQCNPVGGNGTVQLIGVGGGQWNATNYQSATANLRAKGVKLILTVGGAGAYFALDTRTKSTNCLNSIKAIYTQVGGFDGLDFNLETVETGQPVYEDEMLWIAQQLRLEYGSDFIITVPASANTGGAFIQHDIDIVTTLHNGVDYDGRSCLDFVAPQVYDMWYSNSSTSQANRIAAAVTATTFWAGHVGGDWSKIGIGFRTTGGSTVAMTVQSAVQAYQQINAAQPLMTKVFHFSINSDQGQGYAFAQAMAPIVAPGTSTPQEPVAEITTLTDNFATQNATKWNYQNGAAATGGQAVLEPANSEKITTQDEYQFTTGTTYVRIPSLATGDAESFLTIEMYNPQDPNQYFRHFIYMNGSGTTTIQADFRYGPVPNNYYASNGGDGIYDATNNQFFGFRISGGDLEWITAPNSGGSPGAWTVQRTWPKGEVGSPFSGWVFEIRAGGSGAGSFKVDAFNTAT